MIPTVFGGGNAAGGNGRQNIPKTAINHIGVYTKRGGIRRVGGGPRGKRDRTQDRTLAVMGGGGTPYPPTPIPEKPGAPPLP